MRCMRCSTCGSFLPSLTDGRLAPGDASGVKAMLEELAKNKGKIHGWDNKGSVRGRDNVGVPVRGVPSTACDGLKPLGTS